MHPPGSGRREGFHFRRHVGARAVTMNLSAVEMIEDDIAVAGVIPRGEAGAVLQQEMALQPQLGRGRGCLAGVIGLGGALGDDGIGALLQGVAHQKLELAGFIAAGGQSRAVVALDPEARAVQVFRQALHGLERRGQMGQPDAWKAGKMHGEEVPRLLKATSGIRHTYGTVQIKGGICHETICRRRRYWP
jgi:hypothetical protein